MERSKNQKVLLVFSVIEIVAGAIMAVLAILALTGGAFIAGGAAGDIAVDGATLSSGQAGSIVVIAGIVLLVAGVIGIVVGVLGVRAAKDKSKIMPVWVLAIIDVVLSLVIAIYAIANGAEASSIGTDVVSLVISVIVLVVANNIKREAKPVAEKAAE